MEPELVRPGPVLWAVSRKVPCLRDLEEEQKLNFNWFRCLVFTFPLL